MWPAFNAALAPNGTQLAAIVNTVMCQVVTTCTSFFFSHWVFGKFTPTELKLTGMAGGIAIGSVVGAVTPPFVPVVMGIFTGILVSLFPIFDKIWRFVGLRDTTHSFSLHGIVGLASSFFGMVATTAVKQRTIQWGLDTHDVFSGEYEEQGSHQLAALVILNTK
jgi:ammonia channel protein AmtB